MTFVHLTSLLLIAVAAFLLLIGYPKAAAGTFALSTVIELVASALSGKNDNT